MRTTVDPVALAKSGRFDEETARSVLGLKVESICLENKRKDTPLFEQDKLELVKHVSAMANRVGGYIAFGVCNKTGAKVGVHREAYEWLREPSYVLGKFENHFRPVKDDLSVYTFDESGLLYVVFCVPPTAHTIHVVEKEGFWTKPNGEREYVLHRGQVFCRRSGKSGQATAADMAGIMAAAVEAERDRIFNGIRAIEVAPPGADVRIVRPGDPGYADARAYRMAATGEKADAVIALDAAPAEDPHVQIAHAYSIWRAESVHAEGELMYRWYSRRRALSLEAQTLEFLLASALWHHAPCFYWARLLDSDDVIEKVARRVLEECSSIHSCRGAARFLMAWLPDKYGSLIYVGSRRDGESTTLLPVHPEEYGLARTVRVPLGADGIRTVDRTADEELAECLALLTAKIGAGQHEGKPMARHLDHRLYCDRDWKSAIAPRGR